jgi:hypothetical protein
MAERVKEKNPCVHCGQAWGNHPATCADGREYEEQRIFVVSPSSVKTAGKCWRQWASRALGKIKKPEGPAQLFGTTLHTMAECYLLTGAIPDQGTPEGRLFVEGIPFLPKRRLRPDEIEGECRFTIGGVPWIGYYDWREIDRQLIGDHKTSSDPKRWGLTAEELRQDVQAATYAYASGWNETNLKWLYYSKKSKSAYPVENTVTRAQALQVLESHTPIAQQMQALFDANPATLTIAQLNDIPNNPQSCDMCGRGCDFAEHCTLIKPGSLVRKDPNNMANSRVEELKRRIAAAKGAGVAVNPPETDAALEETVKEIANETPEAAPYAFNPPVPGEAPAVTKAASPITEEAKPKRGRPAKAKEESAPEPVKDEPPGVALARLCQAPAAVAAPIEIAASNFGAIVEQARALGCKITITIEVG